MHYLLGYIYFYSLKLHSVLQSEQCSKQILVWYFALDNHYIVWYNTRK